jgi:hypothetical protein
MVRKPAKKHASVDDAAEEHGSSAVDRIAGLLALIATKDMEKEVAALRLDSIGFTSHEISALLDVNENFVGAARHRKKGRKR